MRMRNKKWARPELDACPFFIRTPERYIGRWHGLFRREQPVYLELGCGKGYFLAGAGPKNPGINYMGIDLKDSVLGPARRVIEQAYQEACREPDNILLVEMNIERILSSMGPRDNVDRIYINFCNPWPRVRHHKRRLTHPRQLTAYRKILRPGGEIRFKTDDDGLFQDTLGYLAACGFEVTEKNLDLHAAPPSDNILTEHERMFMEKGIPIKAVTARMLSTEDTNKMRL